MPIQIAKLFTSGNSHAICLPDEFRFEGTEVYIYSEGERVILPPKPRSWRDFFENMVYPNRRFYG
jgi:antitoxin VapB